MLYSILVSLDVLIAAALIGFVLLQQGQGATAGAGAFGGGGGGGASGSVFGAKGSASFMTRATALLATAFFINSIVLAYLASHRAETSSVMESAVTQEQAVDIPVSPSDVPVVNIPEGTTPEEMADIIKNQVIPQAANKDAAQTEQIDATISEIEETATDVVQEKIEEVKDDAKDIIQQSTEKALPSDIPQ